MWSVQSTVFFYSTKQKKPTCKTFVGRTNAWKWFYVSHPRQTDSVVRSEAMQGRALWKMEYWLRSCYGYISYQGCIFRLTCSHPELTEDHVLTSAYVLRVFEGKKIVLDFP